MRIENFSLLSGFISLAVSISALMINVGRSSCGTKEQDNTPESTESGLNLLSSIEEVYLLGEEQVSENRALSLMNTLEIEHPHIVLAQMILESGNFKSPLSQSNNNFFGMGHPQQRVTTSLGKNNGYATYKNWALSVLDYGLWQRRYARGLTEDEYYKMLGDKYAEDKDYVCKVKSIAGEIKMCSEILEYQKN